MPQRWSERSPESRRRHQTRKLERELGQHIEAPPHEPCRTCGEDRPLVPDHDHRTRTFRGWICQPCNKTLGFARDRPEVLRALADYLERRL